MNSMIAILTQLSNLVPREEETLRTRLPEVLFNERITTSMDKMGYGFATSP